MPQKGSTPALRGVALRSSRGDSWFDREIPDVLKSVLRKKKKGVQSSEFVWNHRPNLIGIGVRINRNMHASHEKISQAKAHSGRTDFEALAECTDNTFIVNIERFIA